MPRYLLFLAIVALISACGSGSDSSSGTVTSLVDSTITEHDLALLREEEKLARDVYLTLFDTWGLNIFLNISAAEQRHTDQVLTRLSALGLADPVMSDAIGVFTEPMFTVLFNDLVSQGNISETDALIVGATIEDLDIRDIQEMAARTTDPTTLSMYASLECGSRNHMRSFYSALLSRGVTYRAQFITDAELARIVSTPTERCGR